MDYNFHMRQGQIKFKNGNYREAIKEFKQALNYKLEDTVAWVFLSNTYSSLQEYDNMLESMRNIIKYNPKIKDENDMFYALPPIAKNINKIIELCTNAIKNPAEFKGEWSLVGSYFLTKKEYNRAEIAYLEAIKQHPEIPLAKLSLASVYFKNEKLEEALELTDNVVKAFPHLLHAIIMKAKILAKMEEIDQAIFFCDMALKEDPLLEPAVTLRLELEKKQGKSTINNLNPMEIYENVEVRRDQKDFLLELEKLNKRTIKPLAWAEMELSTLSGFVVRAGYITELNLTFIDKIPPSIRNLKYLKSLLIPHRMDPKGFPDGVEDLQNLEFLLYQNSLTTPGIFRGVNPEARYLTNKICKLKSLKVLNIRDSYGITHLPKCLADLPHLEEINVGNCHILNHIPDEIKVQFKPIGDDFRLKLIRRTPNYKNPNQGWEGSKFIVIHENEPLIEEETNIYIDVPELHPKELIVLNELLRNMYTKEELTQMGKNLKQMPSMMNKQYIKKLGPIYTSRDGYIRELTLNRIRAEESLPESILSLSMLEKLVITPSHRHISIPDNIGVLTNLKELEIHNIIKIPKTLNELKNLEKLTISSKVPLQDLSGLTRLRELKLTLPETGNLNGLETLHSLNSLTLYNPSKELLLQISKIPKLENLELYYIKSNEIPESLGKLKSLKSLKISNSPKLEKLPKSLENLCNLQTLIINYCSLSQFSISINHLPALRILSLNSCKLMTLPSGISYLEKEIDIDIDNNPLDPNIILCDLNKDLIDKEEAINQLSFIINKWEINKPDRCNQEDPHHNPDNVKREAIKALLNIANMKNIEEPLNNHLKQILEEIICHKDPKLRSFILTNLTDLLPSYLEDALQILITSEISHLNLKKVYYLLKYQIQNKELLKRLLIRLSRAFRVIPYEAGTLFELWSILTIKDHTIMFDEAAYYSLAFPTVQDLKEVGFGYVADDDHVVGLSLKGFGLQYLPESIKDFKKLQYLELQDNNISELPLWIGEMQFIINLNLKRNNISSLPSNISELRKKIKINLSQNPISRIYEEDFKKYYENYINSSHIHENDAKVLSLISYIFGKQLSMFWKEEADYLENKVNSFVLDEGGRVISLILHDFNQSKITYFPEEIFNLEKLEKLEISKSYTLNNYSENIQTLKNLTYLNLKDNNLQIFPEWITKITSLKELILSGNSIQEIPNSIKNLKNLTLLDLSYNSLSKIPLVIFEMENLSILSLMGNEIEVIDDSIENMKNLKELYLGNNNLKKLPETISLLESLENLSISYNELTNLPNYLGNLRNLKNLNVSGNKLSNLPPNFCSLTALENLDLSDNQFKSISDCIADIPNLERLNLSYNEMDAPSPVLNSVRGIIFKRKRNPEYDYTF